MEKLKFLKLFDRRILRVSGEDSRDFLQGLLSNDIMRVTNEQTIYAALLTPQGKYLHDFFISSLNDAYLFDCEAVRIDDLYKRLKMFKLRSKVELEVDNELQQVALFGTDLNNFFSIKPKEGSTINIQGGLLFVDPRLKEIGGRIILEKNSLDEMLQNYEIEPSSFEDFDTLRISLGLPDGSRDLKVNKSILLESGFEELNGVDFNKGCYVGQELTARTKYRGLIKKRLTPVRFDDKPPEIGTIIFEGTNNVGEIRSTSGFNALALIRVDAINNSKNLHADGKPLRTLKPRWANF